MTQAVRQIAVVPSADGGVPNTFTMPCEGGGSIVITVGLVPPTQQTDVYRSSSRLEFRDCRSQTVTLNGDPYLETSAEHLFPTPSGPAGDSISTIRVTGGLRSNDGGVQGRVQFNCTLTLSIKAGNGSPPAFTSASSGTITFEQPLGSAPVVRPCGP